VASGSRHYKEQIERDIVSAKKSVEDARKATAKLQKEQESTTNELKAVEVGEASFGEAFASHPIAGQAQASGGETS
jgi:uncharacterized protein YlxW (UPF0749 family)